MLQDTPWSARGAAGSLEVWRRAEEAVQAAVTRVEDANPTLDRHARFAMRAAGLDARHVSGWTREWRKTLNLRGFQVHRARAAERTLLREWRASGRAGAALGRRLNLSPGALARLLSTELLGEEWAQPLLRAAARTAPTQLDLALLGALEPRTLADLRACAGAAAGDLLWGLVQEAPRAAAALGERTVVDLLRAWMPGEASETEAEQQARGEAFDTPDLLLARAVDVEVAEGEVLAVRWVEVKTGWVLPGLSPPATTAAFLHQVRRYADRFGPGLVVWKHGWSPLLAELLPPGVRCVAPRDRGLRFTGA